MPLSDWIYPTTFYFGRLWALTQGYIKLISIIGKVNYSASNNSPSQRVHAISEIETSEIDLSEIELNEIEFCEIETSEIGLSEIAIGEIDLSEIAISEIDLSEIAIGEIDLSEIYFANVFRLSLFRLWILKIKITWTMLSFNKKNLWY